MTKRITDEAGKGWNVQPVGPHAIGPARLQPYMWDMVFKSDDGERVSVPIPQDARDTLTEQQLLALLAKARKRRA